MKWKFYAILAFIPNSREYHTVGFGCVNRDHHCIVRYDTIRNVSGVLKS